jgi:hypothetical protein
MNTKLKTIRGIDILLGILLAMFLMQTASAETVFANEFWISTVVQTNGGNGVYGSGTLDCPYDGSTQAKFDAAMYNLPTNTTIHLLAGKYQTVGGDGGGNSQCLKSGQKIMGSGIDNTIVQLVTNAEVRYVVANSLFGCPNIEVADLTLDCNYTTALGAVSRGGLLLYGTGLVARRVKVINAAFAGTGEVGGINFFTGGMNSEGNIIEECEIYPAPGAPGECTGIGLDSSVGASYWISGVMRNNRIMTPGAAMGGAWMRNTLIEGNYVKGSARGFAGDTGGYTNITVAHNVFENCTYPVFLYNNNVFLQNLMFCYNTISSTTSSSTSQAFRFQNNGGSFTNISIIGNTVTFNGNQPVSGSLFLYADNIITGLIVANNTVEGGLSNSISGCANVSMYNNYDLKGNFLTSLNQVEPPNGVTKRTVMSPTNTVHHSIGINTNYASYADKYIGVKGFPGTYPDTYTQEADIVLPSAVGHAGKDFIIADESGNLGYSAPNWWKKIQIKSTSPDQINGGTSITNFTPYAGMTVISDGTNWFAY